jgi:hypothetical protein
MCAVRPPRNIQKLPQALRFIYNISIHIIEHAHTHTHIYIHIFNIHLMILYMYIIIYIMYNIYIYIYINHMWYICVYMLVERTFYQIIKGTQFWMKSDDVGVVARGPSTWKHCTLGCDDDEGPVVVWDTEWDHPLSLSAPTDFQDRAVHVPAASTSSWTELN